MIAPILRLLAIYCLVGLAVFGFFKRDAIMEMFAKDDAPVAEMATPVVHTNPVTPAPEPVAEPVTFAPTDAAPAVAEPAEIDYDAALNDARSAYWANNRDEAIAKYTALLAHFPTDEAANGELGNIYFMNGQRDLAAAHYEKAGMAAIEDGHHATAQMLIGVLRSLNPNAAARLNEIGANQ